MDEDEPAWKAELYETVEERFPLVRNVMTRLAIKEFVAEQIEAAEQRGRQQALESFVCGVCGHRAGWIDCPTGGWWAHETHPVDNHDATGCVPESADS